MEQRRHCRQSHNWVDGLIITNELFSILLLSIKSHVLRLFIENVYTRHNHNGLAAVERPTYLPDA
jgi:hypothetical protein